MNRALRPWIYGLSMALVMMWQVGCKQQTPPAANGTSTTATTSGAANATSSANTPPVIGAPNRPAYEDMVNPLEGGPSLLRAPEFHNLPKADPAAGYSGPQIGMRLIPPFGTTRQSTAVVDFEAPTEGYTMRLDQSDLVNGVAQIYMTIEMPPLNPVLPPNKTMHRDLGYAAADVVFTHAELWVRHYRTGEPTQNLKWHLALKLP